MVLTGLRGVGKTVLLNTFRSMAIQRLWGTGKLEARPDQSMRRPIAAALHMAVREIAPRHRAPERIEYFLGVLKAFALRDAAAPKGTSVTATFGIDVPAAEVDNAFVNVGTRMGADTAKLTAMLVKGGASPDTLKHRLKAELAWNALVKGRFKSSLEIADSDVEAQLDLHKPQDKNEVGYEYALRPVLFVVPRGSPDPVFEARKKEADALRLRFLTCAEGIPFARALHEVAVRDQVIKFSADLPQALRDILDKTDVGHLTPPEQTAEGVQVFALCSKKENKSETPGRREVRDEIFQQKFGAQAKRYLAQIRREAMIEYKTEEQK